MTNMYKEYIQERQLCEFLESKHSFVTYNIQDDVCYLQDMFICKPFRGQGLSRKLTKAIEGIALEKGCKYLVTSINLTQPGNNVINEKTALSCGFKEKMQNKEGIYYYKELIKGR